MWLGRLDYGHLGNKSGLFHKALLMEQTDAEIHGYCSALQDRKIVAAWLTQLLMTTCTNKLFLTQHSTSIHKGIEESQMLGKASTPRGRQQAKSSGGKLPIVQLL